MVNVLVPSVIMSALLQYTSQIVLGIFVALIT